MTLLNILHGFFEGLFIAVALGISAGLTFSLIWFWSGEPNQVIYIGVIAAFFSLAAHMHFEDGVYGPFGDK